MAGQIAWAIFATLDFILNWKNGLIR